MEFKTALEKYMRKGMLLEELTADRLWNELDKMIYSFPISQLFWATLSSHNRIEDKMVTAAISEDLHEFSNTDL